MVTAVKSASGDRSSKAPAVLAALDKAFADRVSRIFDAMCDFPEPDQAAAFFIQRFKQATDCWNEARIAIEQEYPKSVTAQQLPVID